MVSTAGAQIVEVNRHAYELVARQYGSRAASDARNDLPIVNRVLGIWRWRAPRPPSVLDVGCGAGVNLQMFHDRGSRTTGVDISPEMLRISAQNSPMSHLQCTDIRVLNDDTKYDLVFAKAFIHLFPSAEATSIVQFMKKLLTEAGIIYLATTIHDAAVEGYEEKRDYDGAPKRFRTRWTLDGWHSMLQRAKLSTIVEWQNVDPRNGKRWINVVAEPVHPTPHLS
ncbi:MAG: class I SAM-dependent methyltransferase [Micropruina sp.]|uniref:class I SAM-dependent methyltransferase n=1 Tax=Micropruina sp. TaxID=2737536 RepID=UPI0039E4D97E